MDFLNFLHLHYIGQNSSVLNYVRTLTNHEIYIIYIEKVKELCTFTSFMDFLNFLHLHYRGQNSLVCLIMLEP